MFFHLPVCNYQLPLRRQPPWTDIPLGRHPILRSAGWDTVNKWAVHILLQCNLVLYIL